MKIEITFDELNKLLKQFTRHNIVVKPLLGGNTFSMRTTIGVFAIEILLKFDRIIDGDTLAFDYKLPLGMNLLAGKFKETLSSLIPGRIAEINHRQVVVHLTRIKHMEQYFEHFDVSHFESTDSIIQLQGRLKE